MSENVKLIDPATGLAYRAGAATDANGNAQGSQANPGYTMLVSGASATPASVSTANADGLTGNGAAAISLATRALNYGWNGTAWDRARGDVVSLFAKAPPLAKVDRSITATTTSQQAAAANPTRTRLIVENLDTTNAVFVNLGAAATTGLGSKRIAPLGYWEITGTNQSVNVIAAAGTPAVTIWEM